MNRSTLHIVTRAHMYPVHWLPNTSTSALQPASPPRLALGLAETPGMSTRTRTRTHIVGLIAHETMNGIVIDNRLQTETLLIGPSELGLAPGPSCPHAMPIAASCSTGTSLAMLVGAAGSHSTSPAIPLLRPSVRELGGYQVSEGGLTTSQRHAPASRFAFRA
ncbi:uncharacterized protein LAESUDRAFT_760239 [Laetiporus sulphureus 93-53]|uniref:Uncharacterized protein n=1 Tax=Laetiporus sulphureus 93-53 TaxID=1314785 RepID=A0A165DPT4_9APHY|nr:uncharacterized protein LAESUDRAFT_760239 [Laetiporus sulphureus 93-53]KZT05361.1 hypothetical protein LAESUDRAFT_760239 [Laetiporus sulphureus 93-53]